MYEYCVVVGRFQPFHNGHRELIKDALSVAKSVVVVIGSSYKARTIQNPWTEDERANMIEECIGSDNVFYEYVRDHYYSDQKWVSEVQNLISGYAADENICYIMEEEWFPKWKLYTPRDMGMPHATEIRRLYFTQDVEYKKYVSERTVKYLEEFRLTPEFKTLKSEYDYIRDYRSSWEGAPFPPVFVTTDAVVIKSGHILVVRRGKDVGKGLLALPGGFLNPRESIKNGVIRELREETGLTLTVADVKESRVFDYPERSLRGRTITHAHLFDLGYGPLPPVKGGDDAAHAQWMTLSEFNVSEDKFFEDHFQIVQNMISRY